MVFSVVDAPSSQPTGGKAITSEVMESTADRAMNGRMATVPNQVGELLRTWRGRRRFSQLDLAAEAEVSTRHLSFIESGRSAPSRDMLMRLAARLSLPLRERNRLLLAGGYAPLHTENPLDAAAMREARAAVERILTAHEPYPALAVDRHWQLVSANAAVAPLLAGVAPRLLKPPANVLRLSLDPEGLAPRILNLPEWRHHLLTRLRAESERSGDVLLEALYAELKAIPFAPSRTPPGPVELVAMPLVLAMPGLAAPLSLLSTTTVFGTATDITLSELTLETFFPADASTRAALLDLSAP